MISYIMKRVGRAIFTLFIFETLLFVAILAIPGDNIVASPPVVDRIKQPAEQATASVPTESAPNEGAASDQPARSTSQKCDVKPPVEGLPAEDVESFVRDACADLILQGPASEEQTSAESAPVETQVQDEQAAAQESVITKPSPFQQYQYWMFGLLRGDLGTSIVRRRAVTSVLGELAPRTILLFVPGALIGFLLGLKMGSVITWKRGGMSEFASTVGGVTLFTSFPPFLSFVMVYFLAYRAEWLPRESIIEPDLWLRATVTPNWVVNRLIVTAIVVTLLIIGLWLATRNVRKRQQLIRIGGVVLILGLSCGLWITSGYATLAWDILNHLVLPLTVLILLSFGGTMLLMRASMTEVIKEAHIFSAKAKGLPDHEVRDRHAARLALIPVVSRFALELPLFIIGGFAIERIFFWNGLGQFLFEAANKSDYALIMGIATVVGIVILAAHLLVDILNFLLDPRQRKLIK